VENGQSVKISEEKQQMKKKGRLERNDRNGWFDQECAEIMEMKNRKY
jgi:hypothetical protein